MSYPVASFGKRIRTYEKRKKDELTRDPSKAFRQIQPDREAPLAVLKRPDGSYTGNLVEIDSMLREAWMAIFAKHSTGNPEPNARDFITKYQDFIPYARQELNPLNLDDIKGVIKKLKSEGATGLDHWGPADIQKLPDEILRWLVDLFNLIETVGRWPKALCWAAITLIPKGEGAQPLSQRPISIMSIVYRIWAAARAKYCTAWQENLDI